MGGGESEFLALNISEAIKVPYISRAYVLLVCVNQFIISLLSVFLLVVFHLSGTPTLLFQFLNVVIEHKSRTISTNFPSLQCLKGSRTINI